MFSIIHIHKTYGNETILDDISFNINQGDRLGLIGPNGCGKTTLLRIIAGVEQPDSGIVTRSDQKLVVGYLPQGYEFAQNQSYGKVLSTNFNLSDDTSINLEHLASALALEPENEILQLEYDSLLQQIQERPSIHPMAVLDVLGMGRIPDNQPVATLSGGQKTRLALAKVILDNPHLLLLDEPTNHLDIKMLGWLEKWIESFPGAALIVSHDRTFLDRTVRRILDLDLTSHKIREYEGNYSDYLIQNISEHEKQLQAYRDQVYEIRRMKQDIARTKQQARWVEQTTTSRQPGVRRIAKKVAKKAKSREKKLERYLESDEMIGKPDQSWQMKLEFEEPSHLSQNVLAFDGVSIGYEASDPLVRDLTFTIQAGERIVLTGPNGGGKTTLLRTAAGKLTPLAGFVRLGASIKLGYMTQEQESLPADQTPVEVIQKIAPFNDTEVRSFLHYFLFSGEDPLRITSSLSYGERARLSLAMLVAQGSNFLVLDEPINHLDIPSRSRFEQSLSFFKGTILAVIHDRYFIERFATQVWFLEDGKLNRMSADKIINNGLLYTDA